MIELIIPSHGKVTTRPLHEVVIPVKGPWILGQVITNLRAKVIVNIRVIPEVLRKIAIEGRPIPITLKGALG